MPSIIGATRLIKHLKTRKRVKRKKLSHAYLMRQEILNALGYKNYKEYMRSDLWKSIREKKLEKHPVCLCGAKATQVHHMSYHAHVMLGQRMMLLVSLCNACHASIEWDGARKCTAGDANHRLFKLAAKHGGNSGWITCARGALHSVPHPSDYLGLRREPKK